MERDETYESGPEPGAPANRRRTKIEQSIEATQRCRNYINNLEDYISKVFAEQSANKSKDYEATWKRLSTRVA